MNSPDRRELILEAAAGCFSHFGYRRTVVDDIAREVGIAKGSIYLHFKSKEDLFIALLDHEREKVSARFEEIIAQDITCSERLRRIVVEFNAILDQHPVLARFITSPASLELPPELLRRECHDKGIFDQHIPRILENGIRRGEFRADLDVLAVFPILISLFHINVHNRDHKWVDMPPEKFMEAMLGTIFQGILNKEGSVR